MYRLGFIKLVYFHHPFEDLVVLFKAPQELNCLSHGTKGRSLTYMGVLAPLLLF